MVTLKVRDLVFDHEYYPRQQVDWDHVQRIVDSIEIGAVLPPIIICKETRRIVDGWHRTKAVQRLQGDRGEIACIEKSYATQEAYFLDTIKYNSEHGLALTAKDRFRILELGEELKIDPVRTAAAMSMTTAAVGKLSVAPIQGADEIHRPAVSVSPRFSQPRELIPPPRRYEEFDRPIFRKPVSEGREIHHTATAVVSAPPAPAMPTVASVSDLDAVKRLTHRLEEDHIKFDVPGMRDALVRLTEILVALDLDN